MSQISLHPPPDERGAARERVPSASFLRDRFGPSPLFSPHSTLDTPTLRRTSIKRTRRMMWADLPPPPRLRPPALFNPRVSHGTRLFRDLWDSARVYRFRCPILSSSWARERRETSLVSYVICMGVCVLARGFFCWWGSTLGGASVVLEDARILL